MSKRDLFRDGQFVRTIGDDEPNYVLKDRESIRTSMSFMDGLDPMQRVVLQDSMTPTQRNAPGYVHVADSERERRADAIAARDDKLSDAWRKPATDASLAPATPVVKPGTDARDAVLEKRDRQLENAWRGV